MIQDIKKYVQTCEKSQLYLRAHEKTAGLLRPLSEAKNWEQIGIDIVGPLTKTRKDNMNIIPAVDYASRFALAKAVRRVTAQVVAEFILNEISYKFGFKCSRTNLTDKFMSD